MEPPDLDDETVERARKHIFKALDALHITTGASHAEFKVVPNTREIRLIEIGARMGGDCIGSDLVKLSTGYDFVKMAIQAAAGEPLDLSVSAHNKAAAVRYAFNDEDIANYENVAREHSDNVYRASEMHRKEGEAVTDSSTRLGFYILTGDDGKTICDLAQLPLEE